MDTPWRLRSPISVWRTAVGAIEVHYKQEKATAWEGPFLREERELLDNIAHRIGEYLEWKQRELSGERLGAAPEHWRWRQRFADLQVWFEGWSLCLAEISFQLYGVPSQGLLDVKYLGPEAQRLHHPLPAGPRKEIDAADSD